MDLCPTHQMKYGSIMHQRLEPGREADHQQMVRQVESAAREQRCYDSIMDILLDTWTTPEQVAARIVEAIREELK